MAGRNAGPRSQALDRTMWTDVVDLNAFYRSRLGHATCQVLRRRVRTVWPDVKDLHVMGLGYATPYLRQFRSEAARVTATMPAHMGVTRWPRLEANAVCLAEEAHLPFPDLSIDRLLVVHAVESAESLRAVMREIWRVLAPEGRLLIVVPSRRGLWARRDLTPFGHGKPYSLSQVQTLLNASMFEMTAVHRALYMPPVDHPWIWRSAHALERFGAAWYPGLGGVLRVEAIKRIYAGTAVPARAKRRWVLAPAT
jgi:SAM-dependent methyltransferase